MPSRLLRRRRRIAAEDVVLAVVQSVRAPSADLASCGVGRSWSVVGSAVRGRDRARSVIGSRSRWRRRHRRGSRRTSSTRPRPPASSTGTTASSEFFVGGGVAAFDCDDDGRDDLYFAGGTAARGAVPQREPGGRGAALRPPYRRRSPTYRGHRRLPHRHRRRRPRRPGRPPPRRQRHPPGPRRLRVRARQRPLGIDGGHAWTVAFSATWEGTNALPTLAFGQLPGARDRRLRQERARATAPATGHVRTAGRARRRATARCRCCSATGAARASATSAWRTTGTTTSTASEQLWRIAAGQRPAPLHRGRRLAAAADLGDGHRQPGPHRRRPSRGVPHEPGRQQAPDTGPRARAGPTYEDIALERGVTAQRPYAGGDVLPSTAWHPEFEDVNNDGFVDLFVTKGNVEAQPDYAPRSEQPPARAAGRHVRQGARGRASSSIERARGAALVDLNLDGMLDLVVVNRRANVKVWRNVGRGDAEQPRADGRLDRAAAPAAGPERRRHRCVGRGEDRRTGDVDRELTVGGGHAAGQLGWRTFGLGDHDRAEVRVQWPDGETGPWMTCGPASA